MKYLARRRARKAARAKYWDLDEQLGADHRMLGATTDPATRAQILFLLTRRQLQQAQIHDAAFGVDRLKDDPARDMAQSMRWRSSLYRLLADVEKAVSLPGHGRREHMSAILGERSDEILDQMAATPDLAERMAFVPVLYMAVIEVVGGQAAETVWCLPWPGKVAAR